MGFERFGKVSFAPFTKVSKFVDFLDEGKIKGTVCRACNTFHFPPRGDCVQCLSSEIDWKEISGKAKLVTYTTIHAAPIGFEDDKPYTIGVVDLEEGGRALGWIEGLEEKDLSIGMALKVEIKNLEEDKLTLVLKAGE
ncbi:MAG: Zn-ribbon domain-containing OB-fold protein [Thermoplasmata archaeon]|nr:MAG: Zn-ribbon domain-containing OB-fold protein [Thermoplasmata archaeon]